MRIIEGRTAVPAGANVGGSFVLLQHRTEETKLLARVRGTIVEVSLGVKSAGCGGHSFHFSCGLEARRRLGQDASSPDPTPTAQRERGSAAGIVPRRLAQLAGQYLAHAVTGGRESAVWLPASETWCDHRTCLRGLTNTFMVSSLDLPFVGRCATPYARKQSSGGAGSHV